MVGMVQEEEMKWILIINIFYADGDSMLSAVAWPSQVECEKRGAMLEERQKQRGNHVVWRCVLNG
jgi:hypothetical protein